MLILKQTDGDLTHYHVIDSLTEAVEELFCEEAYIYQIDESDCVSSDCLLEKINRLTDQGDYADLYELIETACGGGIT